MRRRYTEDVGDPIRLYKPDERIEVHSHVGTKWRPATVLGYSSHWDAQQGIFRRFPGSRDLLYVRVDGEKHYQGYAATTDKFRELLQEPLL